MSGFFAKLKQGLTRSSHALGDGLSGVLGNSKLDAEKLQALQDVLIMADLGLPASQAIIAALRDNRALANLDDAALRTALATQIAALLQAVQQPLILPDKKPAVIIMAGVNGAGKTTSIGKLAQHFINDGKSVMLAACDTFRAAASDQLAIWGARVGVEVVHGATNADAAGLAFQALEKAQSDGTDILMIDTAGRLQNNENLMAELAKIIRVLAKLDAGAPHATLLVMDATTGQNGLSQAQAFMDAAQVTGLIITKLDGTARGGVLVPIAMALQLPVHFIGVGEQLEDLQQFNAQEFAIALTGADATNKESDDE